MPITRYGVYHDLEESTIVATANGATFVFSSELYRRKFLSEYKAHRRKRMKQLLNVAPVIAKTKPERFNLFFDIELYQSIEKRGFRLFIEGELIPCQTAQKYALDNPINLNTTDYYETRKQK